MQVKYPDKDDWGKLVRVLKYLNGTRFMKQILSADEMNFTIHWYIDGSHQVHEDCWGQIGCPMTMGKGAVCSSSNKMKCNTQSSTETELILLHDKLPEVVWTRYFVECQGYQIDWYVIFQDNLSALSLEKNGRILSFKRTKHIKAKFFLVKDYYEAGEIDVWYWPIDVMWADVLTKPLQGQKFRDMHAFLQNCQEIMIMTVSYILTNWLRNQWSSKSRLYFHHGSVLENILKTQEKRAGETRVCAVSHG